MKSIWKTRFQSGRRRPSRIGSFDPIRFEELCRADPSAAFVLLRHDFDELEEEFRAHMARYQEDLSALRGRIASCADAGEEGVLPELRDRHDRIRLLLRRIEASMSDTRELEEELNDWEDRRGEYGPAHADHPSVRAEIVRSELRSRHDTARGAVEKRATVIAILKRVAGKRRPKSETATLLDMIRHASAEAERWHDVPYPDEDAVEQIRNVRRLHAILKQFDREAGKRRDRTEFALRMRPHD